MAHVAVVADAATAPAGGMAMKATRCMGCARKFVHLGRHLGKSETCRKEYYGAFDDDGRSHCVFCVARL